MKRERSVWDKIGVCVGLIILITPIVAAVVVLYAFRGAVTRDYSTVPKPQIFQWVWRRPVPAGVTNLRVAGHQGGLSGDVWMRVAAPRATLRGLVGKNDRWTASDFASWTAPAHPDAWKVGWDEVARIHRPAYYEFDASTGGAGWCGAMVVDWERGVLYLRAGLL